MKPRTGFILLAVFVLVLFAIGILLASLGESVCMKKPCDDKGRLFHKYFDYKANPCGNFYTLVCGKNKKMESIWQTLERQSLQLLSRQLQKPISEENNRIIQVAKQVFQGCVSTAIIEEQSIEPILRVLSQGGGFPLIDGKSWEDFNYDWTIINAEYNAHNDGFYTAHFVETRVQMYDEKPTTFFYIPTSLQNAYKLGSENYSKFVVEVIKILNNQTTLTKELEEEVKLVHDFRKKLIKITDSILPKDCSQNKNTEINKPYPFDTRKKESFVTDIAYLKSKTTDAVDKFVFTPGFEEYLKGLVNLKNELGDIANRVMANYVAIEHIFQVIPVLPEKFRKLFDLHFKVKDVPQAIYNNRKLYCAKLVKDQIKTPMAVVFITENYHILENNPLLTSMSFYMKAVATNLVNGLNWMDNSTKYKTIKRIKTVEFVSPLPKEITDQNTGITNHVTFETFYSNLCLLEDSVLETYLSLGVVQASKNAEAASTGGVWRYFNEEFDIFSPFVYYDDLREDVVIPFGILGFPAYDKEWPNYLNYGGVGSEMAREFLRGINFAGSKHELADDSFWTENTKIKYEEKRKCVLDQYNQYMGTITKKKAQCNNSNCVEDIVAEIAAAVLSYKTYKRFEDKYFWHEPRIPKLDKFTPQQMRFITFASLHCTEHDKVYTNTMTNAEMGDPSQEYRVLSSLQNLQQFSSEFSCKEGDKMNPPKNKKCTFFNM